jgi:hypothetical protein
MEDLELKAKKGFGGDYECQQAWPEDTYVQCGDSGLVIGNLEKESYITAFFEAFPKDPSTFLRGEGNSLEEAELVAFNKFLRIKACDGHEYKRYHDSEHADCVKCGLFTSNYFAPTHSCSVCNKPHINYVLMDKSYYCREHYFEAVEKFVDNYDIDNIHQYEGMFSAYEHNKYAIKDMYFTKLCLKYNLVDDTQPEYKLNKQTSKMDDDFYMFTRKKIHELYKATNAARPEDNKLNISGLMFPKINEHLFLDHSLYESFFKDFYKVGEQVNYDQQLVLFFEKLYERYRKKEE